MGTAEWADLVSKVVSKVKNENSLKQDFLGIGGVYWTLWGVERDLGFNKADPAGPGATLSGRLLASQRPQPGCELGLRRTLLADPGSYSLCLPAGAAAPQWTSALSVSHLPKYHLSGSHLLQGKVSFLLPWGTWES